MRVWWIPFVVIATVSRLAAETVAPPVLETHRMVARQFAADQSHEFQFHLQAGEYARIRVDQQTINASIACFKPDGAELFTLDAYSIGEDEDAELVADVSGVYVIRVTASEPNAPAGRYEITLSDVAPVTERHRHRVAAGRAFAQATDSSRTGTRAGLLQSIGQFTDALAHWRAAGDGAAAARALYTIGSTYIEIGDQEKALEYSTQAQAAARAAHDVRAEGRAHNAIAEVHNYFGDKRKAVAYYEQALALMRTAGDRSGEGSALSNLAVAYAHTGEKSKALVLFARAEQIFRELQHRTMIAEVAGNLGVTYDNLGEYRKALENHQNALAIKHELGDRPSEAIALNNIGTAYAGLGTFQQSLDAYTSALEINRKLNNHRNVAINLNNIAWVYGQLADYRRALTLYQESLVIVRRLNDRATIATTLNNIGKAYGNLGDHQKAIAIHTEALTLRRAVGDVDGEANSLSGLGDALSKLGQTDKARQHFEQAVAIHRNSGHPYMLARTLTSLGAIDRQTGNHVQAAARLNEALEISRRIHDRAREAAALAELARVGNARGNFVIAHQHVQHALTALESVRLTVASPALRASFFSSVRDVQELDIDLLMRLHVEQPSGGFAAAALLAAEKARARSLLELLGESAVEIRRGVDGALVRREREVEHLIARKAESQTRLLSSKHTIAEAAAAEKELETLCTELEQIQSRIRQTSPEYEALTRPAPLELKEIQARVVSDDTVLLEYALGPERSFLWAVTPSSMQVFELPRRAEIELAAKRVYDLLTARNQRIANETAAGRADRLRLADEEYISAAAKASAMLLAPAASIIANKRLLVVGEGILQHLPFAALPEPGMPGRQTATPLIVNHEIVTAPSASVMSVLRQQFAGRRPAEKALAIVADPVFTSDDARIVPQGKGMMTVAARNTSEFVRLRFSRYEAAEIARLARAGDTLMALDFNATRETVLHPDFGRYRILHFATHSLLNTERPDLSGIVMSLFDRSGHPQNGFVRLYDIYNLRLSADLVVLSACQTALGSEIKGEGLIGLTRGFLYAGAPRVVASLWNVDDRTTAELMKRFYQAMLERGERPAAALRAAQMTLWKTKGWDAPYYWAAFTHQGEWQ